MCSIFGSFFVIFFGARTQCIHEDMSYLYTGGWRTLRLAGAWARSFCDAAHRWGDRPWDLIFSGTLLVLVPKFENVAPDFESKYWKSSSSWKIPSRTTSLKDLEFKDFLLYSYLPAHLQGNPREGRFALVRGGWKVRQLQVNFSGILLLLFDYLFNLT